MRYGDARQIAALLNDMLRRRPPGRQRLDSASNQIAPGAGVSTLVDRAAADLPHRRGVASPARAGNSRRGPPIGGAGGAAGPAASAAAPMLRRASAIRRGRGPAPASAGRRRRRDRSVRQRRADVPAERADHRRLTQQHAADLRQPGELPRSSSRRSRQIDRPQLPDRDRGDHRGGHAERQPELWRAVLPASSKRSSARGPDKGSLR